MVFVLAFTFSPCGKSEDENDGKLVVLIETFDVRHAVNFFP